MHVGLFLYSFKKHYLFIMASHHGRWRTTAQNNTDTVCTMGVDDIHSDKDCKGKGLQGKKTRMM